MVSLFVVLVTTQSLNNYDIEGGGLYDYDRKRISTTTIQEIVSQIVTQ